MSRTDYAVVTVQGAIVRTFQDRSTAILRAEEMAPQYDGRLTVEKITYSTIRQTIWNSRLRRVG